MKIAANTIVSFHYALTDQTGEVIDSSSERHPLTYLHGHSQIIPGLERQLESLEPGAKATLVVPAAEAYGLHNPEVVFEVERSRFPATLDVSPGAHVMAQGTDEPRVFTVVELREKTVLLDANHPLAGKDLHFAVEVADVRAATSEELAHGHVHDGVEHGH